MLCIHGALCACLWEKDGQNSISDLTHMSSNPTPLRSHKLLKWSYFWLKETEKSISQFGTLQLHSKSALRENWIKLRQADSTPWKMNLSSCFWNVYLPCAISARANVMGLHSSLFVWRKVCFPRIKTCMLGNSLIITRWQPAWQTSRGAGTDLTVLSIPQHVWIGKNLQGN